ncbi:hypothetical protein Tsubulata_011461 [Turnera subulata]|uniref:Ribosome-inactivating protein n=1 Tax=Turnera subulata TaxID=218843 RepID=A0A9Q0GGI3_9ROSI|nr:hypothetical protein Tsubulata_011461 [Turnera subulata]
MKTTCSVVVLVAWICLILVVGADDKPKKLGEFSVNYDIDADAYRQFIIGLRNLVSDGDIWGINSMPAVELTGNQRLGLLRLQVYEGMDPITLVIRLTDLYLVGFHSENRGVENILYYFDDLEAEGNDAATLLGARPKKLGYKTNYASDMAGRETTELGRQPLINAIQTLHYRKGTTGEWKKSLLVLAQMISEAMRSNFILEELVVTFDNIAAPDKLMMNAENCWDALCRAVVNAHPNGDLQDDDRKTIAAKLGKGLEETVVVKTVLDILAFGLLALVKLSTPKSLHGSPRDLLDVPIAIMQQQDYSRNTNWTVNQGEEEEITTSINGPNGLCVDVPGGEYRDGAELILWTCKSDNKNSQLWTFKNDGTIRSINNNWCLNPSSDIPSQTTYIMIYECPQYPSGTRAVWELLQDGTLRNNFTQLVLTAKSDKQQGLRTLTVDYDDKLLGQGWVASNYEPKPILTRVQWLPGLCLNVDSASNVVIGHCEGLIQENKWAIHWHRSITNIGRNGACLTYDEAPSRYKPSVEGRVFVEECSASSRYQRWEITGDGGIMNTGTKVFLTVTKDEDEDGGGNYRLTAQDRNSQALSAQSFHFLVSG